MSPLLLKLIIAAIVGAIGAVAEVLVEELFHLNE